MIALNAWEETFHFLFRHTDVLATASVKHAAVCLSDESSLKQKFLPVFFKKKVFFHHLLFACLRSSLRRTGWFLYVWRAWLARMSRCPESWTYRSHPGPLCSEKKKTKKHHHWNWKSEEMTEMLRVELTFFWSLHDKPLSDAVPLGNQLAFKSARSEKKEVAEHLPTTGFTS